MCAQAGRETGRRSVLPAAFSRFVRVQAEGYRVRADEMRRRGRVLPGAREALEAFSLIPGVSQTVLTGNPRPSAEAKLNIFGLTALLDVSTGAYGDDDAVRANLVATARKRAYERTNVVFTEETTIIIGDSTSDVEAALMGGAQILAIASGRTSATDLHAAGATVTLGGLTDTTALKQVVLRDLRANH
jgi:phosphoglycolate phosphatase